MVKRLQLEHQRYGSKDEEQAVAMFENDEIIRDKGGYKTKLRKSVDDEETKKFQRYGGWFKGLVSHPPIYYNGAPHLLRVPGVEGTLVVVFFLRAKASGTRKQQQNKNNKAAKPDAEFKAMRSLARRPDLVKVT